MAIRMRMHWDGVTSEQYDQVRDVAGWEREAPLGGVLHEAWFEGDQLNVCDVWESAEHFNTFVEQRLMPAVAQVGVQGQPEVDILAVYNWQLEKPKCAGAVVEEGDLPLGAYQALEAKVGWRETPPIGGISHVAAIDGEMARIVTVWESPDDRTNFEQQRIGPAAAELGMPEPEESGPLHQLHALFDAAGVLAAG